MKILFADSPAEVHPKGQATASKGDDWRKNAECRSSDPELFFPIGTGAASQYQEDAAKAVCNRCPARAKCLEWALDKNVTDGVWGGLTTVERAALKRTMNANHARRTPGGKQ